jgi:hypothetical protein
MPDLLRHTDQVIARLSKALNEGPSGTQNFDIKIDEF